MSTSTLRPPLPHVRFAFTRRGTCHVCGAVDVCGRLVGPDVIVCAGCTMQGRA